MWWLLLPHPNTRRSCDRRPDGSGFIDWYAGRTAQLLLDPIGLIQRDVQHAQYVLNNPVKHAVEHLGAAQAALSEGRPFDAMHHAFFGMGVHGHEW